MERALLEKVQPILLDMLREIDRVCKENDIHYFLYRGTFLGAVRHQGFIPWDDDLDVAMPRADYEKFCRIAPEKLGDAYCFQSWHTDRDYAHPFGKVRRRGSVYVEAKCRPLPENGFYVDVYPLDFGPEGETERRSLNRKLLHLYRIKLMKCRYTPWREEDRILWKKRLGYLLYQFAALFVSQQALVKRYESIVLAQPESDSYYEQSAMPKSYYFRRSWCDQVDLYPFGDGFFPGPKDYDSFLRSLYGDYMQLPPEDKRENRHQIMQIEFPETKGC